MANDPLDTLSDEEKAALIAAHQLSQTKVTDVTDIATRGVSAEVMMEFHRKLLKIFADDVPYVYVPFRAPYDLYVAITRKGNDPYCDLMTVGQMRAFIRKWMWQHAPAWTECNNRYRSALWVEPRIQEQPHTVNGYGKKGATTVDPRNQTWPALCLYGSLLGPFDLQDVL